MGRLTKQERQDVHDKYDGRCAYCGDPLVKGWHVDHLEAIQRNFDYDKKKGQMVYNGTCMNPQHDTVENCNPSCASCNILKGSQTLEGFRQSIQQFIQSLNLYTNQYKFAKRYGLVEETGKEVKFYFETVNQQ